MSKSKSNSKLSLSLGKTVNKKKQKQKKKRKGNMGSDDAMTSDEGEAEVRDTGLTELGVLTTGWRDTHQFAKYFEVKCGWVIAPHASWRAREKNEDHLKKMQESFCQNGKLDLSVQVVCIDNELHSRWVQDRTSVTIHDMVRSKSGLQAWSGDHSQETCKRLHEKYPNSHIWESYDAGIYLCADSPDNRRMLRLLSNQSNKMSGLILAPSLEDNVVQCHTTIIQTMADEKVEELTPELKARILGDMRFGTAKSKSTCYQIYIIAHQFKLCWHLTGRILSGECKPCVNSTGGSKRKKKKEVNQTATSPYPWTYIAGIPEASLLAWYKDCLAGRLKLGDMRENCLNHLALMKCRREVANFCQSKGFVKPKRGHQHVSWGIVMNAFPEITNNWLSGWVRMYRDVMGTKDLRTVGHQSHQSHGRCH
jgi:hypothetical protein